MTIIGVDIGKERDHTGIAVLQKVEHSYHLRLLERIPLGTKYTDVCKRVKEMYHKLKEQGTNSIIGVDQTGVGNPIVDLLRQMIPSALIYGIVITSGEKVRGNHVSKRALITQLQILLQGKLLKVPDTDWTKILIEEMQNYQVKITASANEIYEARDDRYHDDLVLALAISCFLAVRYYPIKIKE